MPEIWSRCAFVITAYAPLCNCTYIHPTPTIIPSYSSPSLIQKLRNFPAEYDHNDGKIKAANLSDFNYWVKTSKSDNGHGAWLAEVAKCTLCYTGAHRKRTAIQNSKKGSRKRKSGRSKARRKLLEAEGACCALCEVTVSDDPYGIYSFDFDHTNQAFKHKDTALGRAGRLLCIKCHKAHTLRQKLANKLRNERLAFGRRR